MPQFLVTMKTEVVYEIEVTAASFDDAEHVSQRVVPTRSDVEQKIAEVVCPLVYDNILVDVETEVSGITRL